MAGLTGTGGVTEVTVIASSAGAVWLEVGVVNAISWVAFAGEVVALSAVGGAGSTDATLVVETGGAWVLACHCLGDCVGVETVGCADTSLADVEGCASWAFRFACGTLWWCGGGIAEEGFAAVLDALLGSVEEVGWLGFNASDAGGCSGSASGAWRGTFLTESVGSEPSVIAGLDALVVLVEVPSTSA